MADVRTQVDTATDAFLPVLVARQDAYFLAHGRYWQGLETPNPTPTGGTNRAQSLTRKPTDQTESWADEGHSFPSRSFSVTVDVYDGPRGQGYTLTGQFFDAGLLWRRVINVGPETEREQAWQSSVP